jgi:hypothetical protein
MSGGDLDELLSEGTRVAFRGSVFIDGQHYPHGEKLADLCEELDLEYKQSVTKSTCDLLVSDDLEAQDTKAKLARKYGKPVLACEDFADWVHERLEGSGDVGEVAETAEAEEEFPQVAVSAVELPQPTAEIQLDGGQAVPDRRTPLMVVGLVSVLLVVAVLARRRTRI